MKFSFKMAIFSLLTLMLSACVTVQPEPPVVINGYAGYLEKIALPQGCKINIAIIDFNTPGSIISQKTFDIARAPVPFKFTLPAEGIDDAVDYGVVAMITYNEQVIFQTYEKFQVIHNDKFTTEVVMKKVPH
ncbi:MULTISPECIES: YbaY family lipoprotein [unclassified Shewanella]|uniref:YbaY family lipoprotein n=1 Tax=unclassified Shewanella TaxID=196818 RepID=UPI000970B829|nr:MULTISPECIES: YbaY family lipoprotein [unclassified Shewanella]MDO6620816.1 YbaY family lipoprotein [Shewanella sp. 6_MG-2023]MDO6641838.1 YbaY family lipoprotein [Shewanella sp. 5_MG-2023]MDO6680227.1 YbaY family lipoprotein [Shewanella sp. 4_MG-2023]MDO6777137.1 YbaY family lipoprotein [Shewanella sp. 3_MG-2023]PMG27929.1 chaperone for general secretion pathway YbaY [Shewanella sp. 10N.286.52.C2]